jgi:hypothetical protein
VKNFRAVLLIGALVSPLAYSEDAIDRGRYMIITGHCNNCHTAGYAAKEGAVPEKEWLTGSGPLGYRGPWGTNYPSNLRLTVANVTEDAWVKYAKTFKARPPMPYWSVNETSESDLRGMYRFIKSLGEPGAPVRASLPPGEEPKGPFILWPSPPK